MVQNKTVSKSNTIILGDAKQGSVQLYATVIVKWDERQIDLYHGGHTTITTQTRMNQAANQFGLGFHVSKAGGFMIAISNNDSSREWYISPLTGVTILREDLIAPSVKPQTKRLAAELQRNKK